MKTLLCKYEYILEKSLVGSAYFISSRQMLSSNLLIEDSSILVSSVELNLMGAFSMFIALFFSFFFGLI